MRILISHTNFPAQFRRLAPALVEQGHEVVFISKNREWHAPDPVSGMRVIKYETHRPGGGEALHPYLRRFEASVLKGRLCFVFVSSSAMKAGALNGSLTMLASAMACIGDAFPKASELAI